VRMAGTGGSRGLVVMRRRDAIDREEARRTARPALRQMSGDADREDDCLQHRQQGDDAHGERRHGNNSLVPQTRHVEQSRARRSSGSEPLLKRSLVPKTRSPHKSSSLATAARARREGRRAPKKASNGRDRLERSGLSAATIAVADASPQPSAGPRALVRREGKGGRSEKAGCVANFVCGRDTGV
jgi:hypothetical protein